MGCVGVGVGVWRVGGVVLINKQTLCKGGSCPGGEPRPTSHPTLKLRKTSFLTTHTRYANDVLKAAQLRDMITGHLQREIYVSACQPVKRSVVVGGGGFE